MPHCDSAWPVEQAQSISLIHRPNPRDGWHRANSIGRRHGGDRERVQPLACSVVQIYRPGHYLRAGVCFSCGYQNVLWQLSQTSSIRPPISTSNSAFLASLARKASKPRTCNALANASKLFQFFFIRAVICAGSSSTPGTSDLVPAGAASRPDIISKLAPSIMRTAARRTSSQSSGALGSRS